MVESSRVGYISASDPDELSYDFGSMLPPGLEMVCASPPEPVRLVTVGALAAAERGLEVAAGPGGRGRSGDRGLDRTARLPRRGGYDQVLIDRVHAATGLPVTTNQTAAVDAFRALGVSRIALMNPNTSDLLAHQVRFFEDSGIAVDVAESMEIEDNRDIDCVPPDVSHQFVKSAIRPERPPEGVYLSGPCWRTLDIIGTPRVRARGSGGQCATGDGVVRNADGRSVDSGLRVWAAAEHFVRRATPRVESLSPVSIGVVAATFLMMAGEGSVNPVLPLFGQELGASVAIVGVLIAAAGRVGCCSTSRRGGRPMPSGAGRCSCSARSSAWKRPWPRRRRPRCGSS